MDSSYHYLKARALKKDGKIDLARTEFQIAIDSGDAKGYYGLALLSESQEKFDDAQKQYIQGYDKIKCDAMLGDGIAASIVGVYHAIGLGNAVQSQELAHMWFLIGALKGDEVAQFNLAVHFFTGELVEKNDSYAVYWLTKALEQGYEPARTLLNEVKKESEENR